MAEQLLTGLPASPGEAFGYAHMLAVVVDPASATPILEAERPAVLAAARAALAAAGAELDALAARLRAEGRGSEAEIVETGVLMAADPALDAALESAVVRDGRPAAAALVEACGVHADAIAALPDPVLAARADDVRSLGRRAARGVGEAGDRVAGVGDRPPGAAAGESLILVADDLGPADVAELDPRVAGIALVAGGPSAHAAVVARGLGVPMTVGLGAALLAVADGEPLALDGERERAETEAAAALPAVTADGRAVRVLVNAATAAEVQAGLRAGAEGVGLLRTELAFLHAAEWPDETAHRRALAPVLDPLAGRTATVRVLDFGADKTPPFLAGIATRGLALVLEHREALAAQLRAIAGAGKRTQLRVLLPLVEAAEQVETVRALLPRGARVGAMIETRAAVAAVDEIAAAADFLSIGTNDLTADVLGADRFTPEGAVAHDPRVLAAVAATTAAAHHAGQIVEVCGEAASEPLMVPLLVGLSVDELSVGAARVGATRAAIRALDAGAATRLAAAALRAADAAAVAELLRQAGDAAGESGHSGRPVVTLGQQA
jgi:phosphoenolpyruvate-protein kinase (PTS system EI component)